MTVVPPSVIIVTALAGREVIRIISMLMVVVVSHAENVVL